MANGKTKTTTVSVINKVHLQDHTKAVRAFDAFWNDLKSHNAKNTAQKKALDEQLTHFSNETHEVKEKLAHFQDFLRTVPIASAIAHWIQGRLSEPNWQERYLKSILQLQSKNLPHYHERSGKLVTLEYYMQQKHLIPNGSYKPPTSLQPVTIR